ncbi:hypothetical protein [Mitsuaria sp. GD03876]|uniref:hypothetical protein n=1 Tax=Mitsuaria sp. GD03876 TaxID=2975399 RepID=UPI00244BBE7D|nr:hypothetical protein [Mitsuaria sp. GD03876]MDH0866473.1 hypothetical protein [Mitsuaria sp. GD03876]
MQKNRTIRLRRYRARYLLSSGQRGRLVIVTSCGGSAAAIAVRLLGDDLVQLRVRPAA